MIRYVDRTDFKLKTLEVSFAGMEWGDKKSEIPETTEVIVRLLSKHHDEENIPYTESWITKYTDVCVPTGVWNGIKLCQLTDDKIYVALGSAIFRLHLNSGANIWSKSFADTPIQKMALSQSKDALYIMYSSYKFDIDKLTNLIKIDLDGKFMWSAKTKIPGDGFTGFYYYNNSLVAFTWDGWRLKLDETTGEILEEDWFK